MAYVTVEILDLDTSIIRSRHFKVKEEGALSLVAIEISLPRCIWCSLFRSGDQRLDLVSCFIFHRVFQAVWH